MYSRDYNNICVTIITIPWENVLIAGNFPEVDCVFEQHLATILNMLFGYLLINQSLCFPQNVSFLKFPAIDSGVSRTHQQPCTEIGTLLVDFSKRPLQQRRDRVEDEVVALKKLLV